jgi:murein hydrolase activator
VDRKHHRRAQIYGLTILLAGMLAYAAQGKPEHAGSIYEKEIKRKTDALDSIKTAIDERRKKLRELESAEGNFLARLDYLETNIAESKRYLALLSCRIDTAETTIVRLTDSLREAQELLVDRQTIMKRRLRRAYMNGPAATPLMLLFLSRSPLDAIHRVRYLDEVNRYDRNLLGKIEETRTTIGEKKRSFEGERANLARLLTEKKKENGMLLKEEASRRLILSDIRSKKKSNIAVIAELEASQAELNNIIRLLEQKRKKAETAGIPRPPAPKGAFQQLQGSLPWPLDGPVMARYGRIVHPLYQTVTMNNGIDIGANNNEAVHCVAEGTVIHTGSMRGLGRLVIVDHGNNFLTIYAHLAEIDVSTNQSVTAGTVVGRAGAGGISETPLVHFEIRKSTDALDPDRWLEKRR